MMKVKKFFIFSIIFLCFITFSYSQDQIVYLDLDKVVSNTKAGKSILINLEKSKKNALLNFEKKEADLKKIEEEIKSQKNILSENEYKKKLFEFRKEVNNFRQNRQKMINDFSLQHI